jgi:hypothetical protein
MTLAARYVHCFQVAGIPDELFMCLVLIDLLGVAPMAFNAGDCVQRVHGRVIFVTRDA